MKKRDLFIIVYCIIIVLSVMYATQPLQPLLAKEFNITDLAFRNKFKETFGMTPKKWQNAKKLEKAKLLLETSDYNVTQVCQKCGFDSGRR